MDNKYKFYSEISFIETYITKLEKINIKDEKDLSDDLKYLASSMAIFTIINGTIELAEEACREKGFGSPIEIKDLFTLLNSAKIISDKRLEILLALIRDRNKFAHNYEKLNKSAILDIINQLGEVKGFIKDIEKEFK